MLENRAISEKRTVNETSLSGPPIPIKFEVQDMKNAIAILATLLVMQASTRTVVVPTMPVSPYADTEVSTNIPINKADIGYSDLNFRFDGTPANNLELAFGVDVNTNGVLEAREVDTRFGWRGGRYFIENARTWERFESEPAPAAQSLSIKMHLDIKSSPQQVRKIAIVGTNAAPLSAILSNTPPAWIWRREWNMMRATRRGAETPSDWIYFKAAHNGFAIRLR